MLSLLLTILVIFILFSFRKPKTSYPSKHRYDDLKNLIKDKRLPLMLVDEDQFLQNARRFARLAKEHNKKIRVATKSSYFVLTILRLCRYTRATLN